MAVELTGAATVFSDNGTGGNQAFTIPSDATAVVVIANGTWANSLGSNFDELNWNNGATLDFTSMVALSQTNFQYDLWAYIMTSTDGNWPGTGAKTLYWSANGAVTEGQTYVIQAVKGVDTSTPVRDTDSQGDAGATWTASLTGVVSGDMTFISRGDYYGGATSITHGSGQTEIHETNYNVCRSSTSWEDGEGSPSITSNTDTNYDGNIAFALAQAAAAATGRSPFLPLLGVA